MSRPVRFKLNLLLVRLGMRDYTEERLRVRVDHVVASHEGVPQDEEVNRALMEAQVAPVTVVRVWRFQQVVLWTHFHPVAFYQKGDGRKEGWVTVRLVEAVALVMVDALRRVLE